MELTLGSYLRQILTARRLSVAELVRGAGVAHSGLSGVLQETGRELDPKTLRAIAEFLGVDPLILFRLMGYLTPANDAAGSYSPLGLYLARRFDALPPERQRVLLHTLESLLEDVELKQTIHSLYVSVEPAAALVGIEDALPEIIDQAANWYLTGGRFTSAAEVAPQPDDEVLPDLRYGQLSLPAQERLLSLMRAKLRQIYSEDSVAQEYRR